MTRLTKDKLIDEIIELVRELIQIYNTDLLSLLHQEKITQGHYYYVLSPYANYHVKLFYGLGDSEVFKNKPSMINHKNKYSLWEYKYTLQQLKEHKQEMLKVVEEFKEEA